VVKNTGRQRRIRLGKAIWLVGLLALLAGCGVPESDFATPSATALPQPAADGPDGEILFVANSNIFRWDGDIKQLTDDGQARSPAWNSDGQRIAYVRTWDEGYSDLIIADRSGKEMKQLTNHRPDEEPWSRRFAHYAYWAIDPDWSPTEPDQIIYGSDKDGYEYDFPDDPEDPGRLNDPIFLWLVERDGVDPYILNASMSLGIMQEDPDFDPTGRSVSFTAREDVSATQIWTLNLDSAEANKLVEGLVSDPAWSPDGQSIAFIEQDGSGNNIYIVPSGGGEPYALTNGLDAAAPTWAPDGSGLAFIELADSAFRVSFLPLKREADGRITAGEPEVLFTADGIDVPSGLSWHAGR